MSLQTLILLVLKASIVLSVLAVGLRASLQDATYLFRRPGLLLRALLAMNVLTPLFAIALVLLFDLARAVEIALVALAVSPIPPVLPKKMLKAGGGESYVIGLLAAVGALSIVFVPLAMEIFEQVFNTRLQMTFVSIAALVFITILLPLGLGITVHTLAPAVAARLTKPISLIATLGLLASALAILVGAAPAIWLLVGNGTFPAMAAFVVFGLAVGHLLGGPGPENRASLAFATAARHPGIAIAIAHANFPEEKLALAAVLLFLLVNALVSIPYQLWIKQQSPAVASEVKASPQYQSPTDEARSGMARPP
jgi:BASS family bile acid:Na+ symporter